MSIDSVSFKSPPGVTSVVDIFDQTELFDSIDNSRVVELSALGGKAGFSGPDSVRKSTGISLRRILKQGLRALDLGDAVCHRLESVSGFAMSDFASILLCHSHTDPNACHLLAAELELRFGLPVGAVQPFNHGCSGFLKLMHTAALDAAASADHRPIAVVSVETPELWHDGADRLFCGIVSAGATAVVVEAGRGLPLSTVHADNYRIPADRRLNAAPLFQRETVDGFCFRGNPSHRTVMRMNAEPVFLNGIELMQEQLREAVASVTVEPGQRIIAIPHQPSGKLLKALIATAASEFPAVEFLNNLDQYGNTISSTIPTILARLPDVLAANRFAPVREGDHLILLAAGICMDEIENHMAAGFACMQWQPSAFATQPGMISSLSVSGRPLK